jgi:hypothetical protein
MEQGVWKTAQGRKVPATLAWDCDASKSFIIFAEAFPKAGFFVDQANTWSAVLTSISSNEP